MRVKNQHPSSYASRILA